ncbi:hypothetical protein TSAR_005171 [Trichomalopsis sarcophagae]|uniref:Uncharacterized protein n=1 Tax=Trichomalopsis sarcophagae TaxID=543379 RepID=A0A232EEY2_9HYME|nr:hypothetical protein TSAR_005171 [Trichomalopsis sarcophagae]
MSGSNSGFNRIIVSSDVFFGKSEKSESSYLDDHGNPIRPPTPQVYTFDESDLNGSWIDELFPFDSERSKCARRIDKQSQELFGENVLLDQPMDATWRTLMEEPVPMSPQRIEIPEPVYTVEHVGGAKIKIKIQRNPKKRTWHSIENIENVPAEPVTTQQQVIQPEKVEKVEIVEIVEKVEKVEEVEEVEKVEKVEKVEQVVEEVEQVEQVEQVVEEPQQTAFDANAMFRRSNGLRKVNYAIKRPPPAADNSCAATKTAGGFAGYEIEVAPPAIGKRRVAHKPNNVIMALRHGLNIADLPQFEQGSSSSNSSPDQSRRLKSTSNSKPALKRSSNFKKIARCLGQTVVRKNHVNDCRAAERPATAKISQEKSRPRTVPIASKPRLTLQQIRQSTEAKLLAAKRVVRDVNPAGDCLPPISHRKKKMPINAAEAWKYKSTKKELLQRAHGNSLFQLGAAP